MRVEKCENLKVNGECSFKGTVRIPGAWQHEQQGIHSYNWFSTRDPNTASQWQADNSANFSQHSLWMALYDRLVECDWWPGLNNRTTPPSCMHTKTWQPLLTHKHFLTARQYEYYPLEEMICTHNGEKKKKRSCKTNQTNYHYKYLTAHKHTIGMGFIPTRERNKK